MRPQLNILLPVTVFILLFSIGTQVFGQTETKPASKENPSWALDKQKKNDAIKTFPKRIKTRYIIITETKGVLHGNPCAVQETQKMGFQYLLLRKGQPGYETTWDKVANNVWIKTGLVVRKSPFWKMILKKRIEDCRVNTGDFVGMDASEAVEKLTTSR